MNHLLPVEIELPDLTIRGLRTSTNQTTKVLCIHGWLDNANSFYTLGPLLKSCDVVAIDLPGHGKSDHFKNSVPYTVASSMHYALQVAEKLGWNKYHIVGHSLGGCIAPMCAVASVDSILSLSLIDALGPIAEQAAVLPDRLCRFHREISLPANTRLFDSVDDAVAVRMKAVTMTEPAARLIVERQLKPDQNKLRWGFDNKARAASPSYFTESQVQAILSAIQCPVLCVIAEQGYLVKHQHLKQRTACVKQLEKQYLPGNHHLHMDNAEPVAEVINRFLSHIS